MPHSSGGGSHGGGSHGGSHGSSGSSNRISHTYFPGARRFRRHYTDGRPDEYIYATSKPAGASLSAIIFVGIFGAIFCSIMFFSYLSDMPGKLKTKYKDAPCVYDEIDIIADDEALEKALNDYCDVTGICPVIYTTYDETWAGGGYSMITYEDLESYAFDMYVDHFSDEQHFVIVYSLPMEQAMLIYEGNDFVPDYQWEAIQGDETDPIITESYFRRFADRVQDELEAGKDPGEAFEFAFKKATSDAESVLNPAGPSRILKMITSLIPVLIVAGIFVPVMIGLIKNYKKEKNSVLEEVPLDNGVIGSGLNTGAYSGTYSASGTTQNEVGINANKVGSKVSSIISLIMLIPFFISGIIILFSAIATVSGGDAGGYIMLGFSVFWLLIVFAILGSTLKKLAAIRKEENKPENVSYPTSEYPQPVMPGQNPVNSNPVQSMNNTEFDPQFFSSPSSNYEQDDEDYRRMKRQGYE